MNGHGSRMPGPGFGAQSAGPGVWGPANRHKGRRIQNPQTAKRSPPMHGQVPESRARVWGPARRARIWGPAKRREDREIQNPPTGANRHPKAGR